MLDLSTRDLRCACRPCSLLFDRPGAGGGHFRLVPERRLRLTGFELADAAWEELRIPVDMAFFFHSSAAERVVAFYPGPMGATESLLELSAWEAIEAANPVLAGMEPDVEALLVNRARGARDSLARPDRRLLRARGPDPHALAGPDGRKGRLGGDRALLRCARPALTASRGQRGDDDHMSTSYPYLKVGKPDVKPDAPSHTPGIKQGNSKGQLQEADGPPAGRPRDRRERSTGINPDKRGTRSHRS